MSEEEKKERYRNIVRRLRKIDNMVEGLNNDMDSLVNMMSRTIYINDEAYNIKEMKQIGNKLNSVSSNINGKIIVSLNNKIANR